MTSRGKVSISFSYLNALPTDIEESPEEEKLRTEDPIEFPEDVDVMDEPPGDEDNKEEEFEEDDVGNVAVISNEKGEGGTDCGRQPLSLSMDNDKSLLLLQEDRLEEDLDIDINEACSTESWLVDAVLPLLLMLEICVFIEVISSSTSPKFESRQFLQG